MDRQWAPFGCEIHIPPHINPRDLGTIKELLREQDVYGGFITRLQDALFDKKKEPKKWVVILKHIELFKEGKDVIQPVNGYLSLKVRPEEKDAGAVQWHVVGLSHMVETREASGKKFSIVHAPNVTKDQFQWALKTPMFQNWLTNMSREQLGLERVEIQNVDRFKDHVGFMMVNAKLRGHSKTASRPHYIFMRGNAVAILVIWSCKREEYAVLTRQIRVPAGYQSFPEIPAGMEDPETNVVKPNDQIANVLKAEMGICIDSAKLIDLTELAWGKDSTWSGFYPSPGGCDEAIKLMLYREYKTENDIIKLMASEASDPAVTCEIVPLHDLWHRTPDMKTFAAVELYTSLREAGLIPVDVEE